MNLIEREARRMNIFRKIMAIDNDASLRKIEVLLEDEEKTITSHSSVEHTQYTAAIEEDLKRAISGEELIGRLTPRIENLVRK